ncbi:MAG: DUF1178 family protein [Syntrophales bacterium]|nr:DUF1178 family protein [Syntrophales bacterium]
MIIYDLKCEKGHKFEGWFKDRVSFEEQRDGKLIACPICGSVNAEMIPSSIAVMTKEGKSVDKRTGADLGPMQYLQMVNQFVKSHFDDVGDRFAEVALKIHHGEEDQRNIRGTTTPAQEETLKEEGVPFIKIPEPKFDS